MASALQCPACGHKHRLTGLSGEPVFACEECGRLLKTPVEYRRPDPSTPAEAPRPNGSARSRRGGSPSRQPVPARPAARAAPAAPRAAAAATPPRRRRGPRPPATIAVPLQILAWVAAVLLGGIIVRYLARWTGLLTGDSVIDIITGSGWGRYLRLFALVPFWALVSAGLMTAFVEGGRWWAARRGVVAGRPPGATAKPRPAPRAASKPAPAPATRRPSAEPEPAPAPTPAPAKAATETRTPSAAAAAPRVRRIPKRDISSLGDGT
ncbi:MAG TPA: hypothetical protein VGN59_09955 [Acidimicrobiia bacterium]